MNARAAHRRLDPEETTAEVEEVADSAAVLRLSRSVAGRAAADEEVAQAGFEGAAYEVPFRGEMEERFGTSFAGVRAHLGLEATAAGDALGADAYAIGNDVAFAGAPTRETVAHELTHVVQQRRGAGAVERDEAEAEAVAAGGSMSMGGAREGGGEALRMQRADDADSGKLLSEAKVQSAIAFNNKRWQGPHRAEILAVLRAEASDSDFEEADVLRVAAIQKAEGAEGAGIDGKIGSGTMATLMRRGLELSAVKAKPGEVKLLFYPGEFEDIEAWKKAKEDAIAANGGQPLGESEFAEVSARRPPGHGTIYVQVGGNIVDAMEARGGPPIKLKDHGGHTADPSQAGTYKLGAGKSHVTSSWHNSQIPWGAQIREQDGEIQYTTLDGTWAWATGPKAKFKSQFGKAEFHVDDDESKPLLSEWRKNDFGETAFRVEGSPGLFIHTTPGDEEAFAVGGQLELEHSHGCLHVQPSDRERLIQRGYLAKGVTIVIKKYSESLDLGATNKK